MFKERLYLMKLTDDELQYWNNGVDSSDSELSKSLFKRLKKLYPKWKILRYGMCLEKGIWYGDMVVEVPSSVSEELFTKRRLEDGTIFCDDEPYNTSRYIK